MLQRCVLMALAAIASLPLQLTVAGTRHHTASHSRAEILAIGAKVADWQLAHLDNFDYIPANQFRRDAEAPRDWVQAAFYIGLAAFADTTRNVHYEDAILAHGEAEAWGFDARPRHADADATGAVWVWASQRTHDPAKLGPIRARFDAVLADPSTVSLEFGSNDARCQERWCWSDALFMAPPTWIALSQACGDERYLAHADQEFWATTHYLYDPRGASLLSRQQILHTT
jgi:unsaturated rhamnogalacturonyl hydrolase